MAADISVNYMHIFAAGLAAWMLGALWYSALFQKPWLKEMGITKEMMRADMAKDKYLSIKTMIGGAVAAMVTAWVMSYEIAMWKAGDGMTALQVTFWIWLGFVAMTQLDSVLYERRSWKLFAINTSYRFCALLVTALILALWK